MGTFKTKLDLLCVKHQIPKFLNVARLLNIEVERNESSQDNSSCKCRFYVLLICIFCHANVFTCKILLILCIVRKEDPVHGKKERIEEADKA